MSNPIICGIWTQWTDNRTGRFYYHNSTNNTVTWIKPPEFTHTKDVTNVQIISPSSSSTTTTTTTAESQWLWFPHDTDGYVPAVLRGMHVNGSYVYRLADGTDIEISSKKAQTLRLYPVSRSSLYTEYDDLVKMDEISPGSILHQLKKRYNNRKIYTSIGSILVSINPYEQLPIYNTDLIHDYRHDWSKMPPHIYKIASQSYALMMQEHTNQGIVISGESGSGKTEATKLVLQLLSEVTRSELTVAEEILNSNPVLESFGNAKTIQNNNSSRFGKWVELFFDSQGRITAAQVINYLLEKSRVVTQSIGERNYHIFYQLCAGMNDTQAKQLFVHDRRHPKHYDFLNQSQCYNIEGLSDATEFHRTITAMKSVGFSDNELNHIWSLLASLLHLGNLKFQSIDDEKTTINDESKELTYVSKLLCLNPKNLQNGICYRKVIIHGETTLIPLRLHDAIDARNAFVKSIYSKLFEWIVLKLNLCLNRSTTNKVGTIGILDIFGFEIFENNAFEQFCINWANEKLQQHFNNFIFKMEQNEYKNEGINVKFIEFQDNQVCLDLIEAKLGILRILDDDSNVSSGNDMSFVRKLHNRFGRHTGGHQHYEEYLKDERKFIIHHYAGSVTYNSHGFVEKNTDKLHDSLAVLIDECENELIHVIFAKKKTKEPNNNKTMVPMYGTLSKHHTIRKKKQLTLSGQFKRQLNLLYEQLCTRNPHFVRCVKPNVEKVPQKFQSIHVLRQIQYAGLFEAVHVRAAGFPFRMLHSDFIFRYSLICENMKQQQQRGEEDICQAMIQQIFPNNTQENVQIGKTKIFMKLNVRDELNRLREASLVSMIILIQAWYRGERTRRMYKLLRQMYKTLQNALQQRNIVDIRRTLKRCDELDDQYEFIFITDDCWFIKNAKVTVEFWEKEAKLVDVLKKACSTRTIASLMHAIELYDNINAWKIETNDKTLCYKDDTMKLHKEAVDALNKANVKAKAIAVLQSSINATPPVLDAIKNNIDNAINVGVLKQHHVLEKAIDMRDKMEHIIKWLKKTRESMNISDLQGVEDCLYELSETRVYYRDEVLDATNAGTRFLKQKCATFIDQAIRGEHYQLCEQWLSYARLHAYDDLVHKCEEFLEEYDRIHDNVVEPSATPRNLFTDTLSKEETIVNELEKRGYKREYATNVAKHIDPLHINALQQAEEFISRHPPVSPPHLLVSISSNEPVIDKPKAVEPVKKLQMSVQFQQQLEKHLASPKHEQTTKLASPGGDTITELPPPRPPAASFAHALRKSMARRVSLSSTSSLTVVSEEKKIAAANTAVMVMESKQKNDKHEEEHIDSKDLLLKNTKKQEKKDIETTKKPESVFTPRTRMIPLGNYVEDLSRYCVFLVMRDQFNWSDFPFLRPVKNYLKGLFFGKRSQLLQSRLCWQKNDIPRSLIRLSTKMCGGANKSQEVKHRAIRIFADIIKFMGDRFSNYPESNGLAVIEAGVKEPLLRDEIFCQIMKQTTKNTSSLYSLTLGWKLMYLACVSFPPSDKLYPYLLAHLANDAHTYDYVLKEQSKTLNNVNDLATHSYFAVKNALKRKPCIPSLEYVMRLCEGDEEPPKIPQRYLLDLSEPSRIGSRLSISEVPPPPPPESRRTTIDQRMEPSWSLSISIPPPPPPEGSDAEHPVEPKYSVSLSLPPPPPATTTEVVVVAVKKEEEKVTTKPTTTKQQQEQKTTTKEKEKPLKITSAPPLTKATSNRSIAPPPSSSSSSSSSSADKSKAKTKRRIIKPPPPAPSKNKKKNTLKKTTTSGVETIAQKKKPKMKTSKPVIQHKTVDDDGIDLPPPPP